MTIRLTPDSSLPIHQVHVSSDIDWELLSVISENDLEVVIDHSLSGQRMRISPRLLDRINRWMDLSRLTTRPCDWEPE